ncbi:TetR family transcriptional regulator [Rhodococcus sp. BP-349]|nr:TetR family transcriptional regulator [Rhodococcus sp. BP-363]MBY6542783.1 TetR family transcriptional regulator [Rhodococcus sp. BP-369]MBY6562013.1 TetR family transcriptional regulator [Rhodococcus sp. BP-370]MBY6576305.1 TetR family transcriptional regulator [Rhodococcus sp. BP-364]MBY6585606.1 TetR family transcriptional regulator [Rhodococcus sp. BP-358]MBY6589943.1 TetR family transcriptional regulator [Rhodococcus sp. BP-362]MBY6593524.1 TetR family transcriptional regulator [Rhodo
MCSEISLAALELFERQGFAATTVGDIARDAGISQSTYFRHFPTKEQSVVGFDAGLEREILAWVTDAEPSDVGLAGIETIVERFLARMSAANTASSELVMRIRRLIVSDAHLRSAAIALDEVVIARLAAALAARVPRSPSRLTAETAIMTVRIAFDTWAARVDDGDRNADLAEIYRVACRDLRTVVTGVAPDVTT